MAFKTFFLRIGAAGALALATLTPLAMADQRGDRYERGHYDRGHYDRGDRHRDRGYRHHRRDRYDRRDHRRDWRRYNRYHNNRGYYDRGYYNRGRVVTHNYYNVPAYRTRPRVVYHYNRGYYHPRYRIGSHFNYGADTIVIRDYGRYGLYNPPRGHRWVHHRGSNDAVLTSVATGAIVGLAIGILAQ